jgi:hypothetical protein
MIKMIIIIVLKLDSEINLGLEPGYDRVDRWPGSTLG